MMSEKHCKLQLSFFFRILWVIYHTKAFDEHIVLKKKGSNYTNIMRHTKYKNKICSDEMAVIEVIAQMSMGHKKKEHPLNEADRKGINANPMPN